jgi:hypothetical protein
MPEGSGSAVCCCKFSDSKSLAGGAWRKAIGRPGLALTQRLVRLSVGLIAGVSQIIPVGALGVCDDRDFSASDERLP